MAGLSETLNKFENPNELENFLTSTPEALDGSPQCRPFLHFTKLGDSHVEHIKVLFRLNANPNLTDQSGETALHTICKNGYEDLLREFIKHTSVEINITNKEEQTPLQFAAIYGHVTLSQLLIEKGANYDIISCAALGDVEQAQKLLSHSPQLLNAVDPAVGCTPLQAAILNNQSETINFLLKNGADANIADRDGHNSLWLAKQLELNHIEQLLGNPAHLNSAEAPQPKPLEQKHPAPSAQANAPETETYRPF